MHAGDVYVRLFTVQPLLCRINRHKPRRRDVQWDGISFVGRCTCCTTPVYRVGHNHWRDLKDRPET